MLTKDFIKPVFTSLNLYKLLLRVFAMLLGASFWLLGHDAIRAETQKI